MLVVVVFRYGYCGLVGMISIIGAISAIGISWGRFERIATVKVHASAIACALLMRPTDVLCSV